MTQNEYIAAGSDVGELLQIAEQLPGVTVKKSDHVTSFSKRPKETRRG